MAFNVDCHMIRYELRAVRHGTSNKGNKYATIVCEDLSEGRQAEVSCTNESLFDFLDYLRRGDIISMHVRAISSQKYSFISLLEEPLVEHENVFGQVSQAALLQEQRAQGKAQAEDMGY